MPEPHHFCPQPKGRPHDLDRQALVKLRDKIDRQERAKCHQRSGGRCEVVEVVLGTTNCRCWNRATQNHHLKSGIGRRNKGKSILAEHRIDTCDACHTAITRHVLRPVGEGREDAATVRYERAS